MTDRQLEAAIRSLVPAPLPDDLTARLAEPPPAGRPACRWLRALVPAGIAAAAATLALVLHAPLAPPEPPAVTVDHRQSTLIESRTVALIDHDGRTWEIAEELWHDAGMVVCSATPVRLRMDATRREVVCRPVHFY